MAEEFRAACRTAADLDVIQAWIAEVQERGPFWMRASEMLAAYGYGKPAQSVTVAGDPSKPIKHEHYNLEALTDDELVALRAARARAGVEQQPTSEPH